MKTLVFMKYEPQRYKCFKDLQYIGYLPYVPENTKFKLRITLVYCEHRRISHVVSWEFNLPVLEIGSVRKLTSFY